MAPAPVASLVADGHSHSWAEPPRPVKVNRRTTKGKRGPVTAGRTGSAGGLTTGHLPKVCRASLPGFPTKLAPPHAVPPPGCRPTVGGSHRSLDQPPASSVTLLAQAATGREVDSPRRQPHGSRR